MESKENQAITTGLDTSQEDHIKGLAAGMGLNIEEMPEFKAIQEAKQKMSAEQSQQKTSTNSKVAASKSSAATKDEDEDEVEENDNDEGNESFDDEDDQEQEGLSGKKSGNAERTSKGKDVFGRDKTSKIPSIEKIEDLKGYISKRYGMEDEKKFLTSVDKWRKDSQELSKATQELDEIKNGLSQAPVQILTALDLWMKGEDWENQLVGQRIDFTKPFEKQKDEAVLNYYYPDKYKSLKEKLTSGKMEEDDFNERVSDMMDLAKQKYGQDKKSFEEKRAETIRAQQQREEALKESALGSVEKLTEKFPGFERRDLNKVRQILVNGSVDSLFYDRNGKYLPEAAERIAYALYGDSLYEPKIESAQNKGKTEVIKTVIERADKTPKVNGNQQDNALSQEQEKAISHLSDAFTKSYY